MRVLIASRRGRSGVRTYTDLLAAELAARDHDVYVLDETAERTEPQPGITSVPIDPAPLQGRQLAPLGSWVRRPKVLSRARELEVDVVHATFLDVAPRFESLVVTAWDPLSSPLGRFRAARGRGDRPVREAAYAAVDAVAYRRARAIVAITEEVARGVRPFRRPVTVVPPFLPDRAIRPHRRRSQDVVMVSGQLDRARKGLDVAVDAVRLVRETHPATRLALIGGWAEPAAQDRLPDFCDVVGPVDREELAERLGMYGCCVLPSLWEEFGYAALEALAAGVPVAAAPKLGLGALSGGGLFVAERRDARSLGEQVRRALGTEEFSFPSECRAGHALETILRIYRDVASGARRD